MLNDKKLILVCGSGGVGKTTLAATLGLKATLCGKKVIVLTIDPAKRLASSLGLLSLSGEPMSISPVLLEKVTGQADLHMEAMMLDTKQTFDQLVIKYAPTKETEKKILNNKIYRHLSAMISGSQEYMAMEKLYEIVEKEKYDLVVIDTPPTIHALDFLEAPQRMINALSHSMIHLLLKPALFVGKSSLKFVERGSQLVFKVFDRITGFAILQDISEMLISFQTLLGGFVNRAEEVKKILQREDTAFVMVAACEEKSVEEAEIFSRKLLELKLPLAGLILNRVCPSYHVATAQEKKDLSALSDTVGKKTAEKMMEIFVKYQKTASRDGAYAKKLELLLDANQFLMKLPLFQSDIHDLKGLFELSAHLSIND